MAVAVDHADAIVCLGEHEADTDVSLAAFKGRMQWIDERCAQAGRDPASLRRAYFAGWADERIFASPEATADLIGRYANAGATDFTFYLYNPAIPQMEGLVDAERMATREQFERTVDEVFPQFR